MVETKKENWDRERTKQNRMKVQRKQKKIETWGALWLEHDPKAILETRCWRFLWVSEAAVVATVTVPMKTRKHRHSHSHRGGHWSTPICRKVLNALCIERDQKKKERTFFSFFRKIFDHFPRSLKVMRLCFFIKWYLLKYKYLFL